MKVPDSHAGENHIVPFSKSDVEPAASDDYQRRTRDVRDRAMTLFGSVKR